jgi:2-oxoglutarate ferredoxin oxidoreductase subunit delta
MAETKKAREITKIDIFKAWCKACGICAHFCPTGVLGRDEGGYPFVQAADKCINCGWCEIRCPDFAIRVAGRKKGEKKVDEEPEKERSQGEAAPG